jgi:hypothetical protein
MQFVGIQQLFFLPLFLKKEKEKEKEDLSVLLSNV